MALQTKGRSKAALVPSCQCEVVERGPNWLFLKVSMHGDPCGVAQRLWEIARSQFVYRLVVEVQNEEAADEAALSELGLQLGELCDKLGKRGGALRLAGLSPDAARAIVGESGCPRLHNHATVHDAVWCHPCDTGAADEGTVVASFEEETARTPHPR